ncbi:MAG: hypothetical protein LUH82_04840 [Clostridiales bacterium]|nr:hypothetical protein [Clostridiales bacterium]
MFYRFDDDVTTADIGEIDSHMLSAGYVLPDEFKKIYMRLRISDSDVKLCAPGAPQFKEHIKTAEDYSAVFLKMGIAEKSGAGLAVFIKKNFMLVVDLGGNDSLVRKKFLETVSEASPINAALPKLLAAFFTKLIENDGMLIEKTAFNINRLEKAVFSNTARSDFNFKLLQIKNELLVLKNHYKRLIEVAETLAENENEIIEDSCKALSVFAEKVKRLREDADQLRDSVNHLQDAYSSFLELKLNETMKTFTSVTTVFFPLTLIVGWYGMNFTSMPEVSWKYGYIFVILLSGLVVGTIILILKKHRGI